MGKKGDRRKKELRRLRKLNKQNPKIQSDSDLNKTESSPTESMHRDKKVSKFSYFMRAIVSIGSLYLSTIVGDKLMEWSFTLGFIFPIIVLCVCLGYWAWELIYRFARWRLFNSPIKRVISVVLVMSVIWLSMPLYVDALPTKKTMEFERPYFDSTQVFVHYGTRDNDFFWTQKTIGELKQKSSVALNVNGENIFTIHTDGTQIFVDAVLFAGYENKIVPEYTSIGSVDIFSIEISGYLNTDAPSSIGRSFDQKHQPKLIKNKALAPPVKIENNAITNNPGNWNIHRSGTGFEITNENNIPVLVLEYKSPYEITISGLFLTSFGILKVDNNEDTIFEFGDSPFELGIYRVDRIKPRSVFDLFIPERTYVLIDKGR